MQDILRDGAEKTHSINKGFIFLKIYYDRLWQWVAKASSLVTLGGVVLLNLKAGSQWFLPLTVGAFLFFIVLGFLDIKYLLGAEQGVYFRINPEIGHIKKELSDIKELLKDKEKKE